MLWFLRRSYRTCHCVPLFHFPHYHTQIPANHLSVLACWDAMSSEHQSSSLHRRLVFTLLDCRCHESTCTPIGTEKLRDIWHAALLCREKQHRSTLFFTVEWHGDGLEIHRFSCMCFFLYEHTLIILILHPPSGPIGPAGVRGSAYAASFSLHKGITVTRWRVLNLLPSLYDFFFPFQEEIFHLEPGKVESGKGKCSYDPKLNSVSALISKYHLGLVTWDCRHRHGPAQFLLATAVSSHMDSSSFLPFLLI